MNIKRGGGCLTYALYCLKRRNSLKGLSPIKLTFYVQLLVKGVHLETLSPCRNRNRKVRKRHIQHVVGEVVGPYSFLLLNYYETKINKCKKSRLKQLTHCFIFQILIRQAIITYIYSLTFFYCNLLNKHCHLSFVEQMRI